MSSFHPVRARECRGDWEPPPHLSELWGSVARVAGGGLAVPRSVEQAAAVARSWEMKWLRACSTGSDLAAPPAHAAVKTDTQGAPGCSVR